MTQVRGKFPNFPAMIAPNLDTLARRAFAVAYQFTGSVMDAEDIRQEVLLEWLEMDGRGDTSRIERPESYCRRAAANKAINLLKRRNREQYAGEWLPEPLMDDRAAVDAHADLSYGFVHLLSQLNAQERAVFILRESLELPFNEIAETLEIQEDHARKLFQRSHERLHSKGKPQAVDLATQQRLVQAFMGAVGAGDLGAFKAVLREDVVVWSDGGGKRKAAMKPIFGVENAFKFLVGITAKNMEAGMEYGFDFKFNGLELLLILTDLKAGVIDTVAAFDIRDGVIGNVYLQRNPDKLAG